MREALNPRYERDNYIDPDLEISEESESTPINSQVAEIRNAIARLKLEIKLCDAFLKSPNITDGPNMDKPIKEVETRVNQVRRALRQICGLDIGHPEFEVNLGNIRNKIFMD